MSRRSSWIGACVLVALAASFTTTVARAETPPTLWDRTKDPTAKERYSLHLAANHELEMQALDKEGDLPLDYGVQRARNILESAHAAESKDPLLRIDLGVIYEKLQLNTAAVKLLTSALEVAPRHVAAERAWNALAFAYARMDRPAQELAAYEQYLAMETDEEQRASAVLNMAEAEMRRGNLKDAITGYEEALRLSQDIRTGGAVSTYVLSIWGLAVAKDRNGDSSGAMIEARRAVSHDRLLMIISDQRYVFFVPAYERSYYQGLGELALSLDADNARDKVQHAERAERRFTEYVKAATGDDRWLARAKEHQTFARKRQTELRKSLPRQTEQEDL